MAGAIHVETVTNPIDFYILLAPGVVLGVFVGMKVAQLGHQHLPNTVKAYSLRSVGRILLTVILIGGTFAYLRALSTLRGAIDEWAFLAIGGFAISFLLSSIPTGVGSWVFNTAKKRFRK